MGLLNKHRFPRNIRCHPDDDCVGAACNVDPLAPLVVNAVVVTVPEPTASIAAIRLDEVNASADCTTHRYFLEFDPSRGGTGHTSPRSRITGLSIYVTAKQDSGATVLIARSRHGDKQGIPAGWHENGFSEHTNTGNPAGCALLVCVPLGKGR